MVGDVAGQLNVEFGVNGFGIPGGGNNGDTTITTSTTSDPWWQVGDSDITSTGSINSDVPAGEMFNEPGTGGYAGVVNYNGATNLTTSNVSTDGWLTQSPTDDLKVYDYNYFENATPDDVNFHDVTGSTINCSQLTSGAQSYGYYWNKYTGPADLHLDSNCNLGNNKVILFVDNANLYIDTPVNVNDGVGFLLTVVDNNIFINPSVGGGATPNVEGFYVTDNNFDTGSGSNDFHLRGAIVAYGGIIMTRDLAAGNSSAPAEFFEYGPDQTILFPAKLGLRKISWKEVAP